MKHYLQLIALECINIMSDNNGICSSNEETDEVEPVDENANVAQSQQPTQQSAKNNISMLTTETCEQETGGGAKPNGMSIKGKCSVLKVIEK